MSSNSKKKAKRLCFFAHWDPDDIIDVYVIYYVTELSKVSDVVFYSDCNLSEQELGKLDAITIAAGAERHQEYDFGSYKRAYLLSKELLGKYDELILANDSCYGPFCSLENLLNQASCQKNDLWGLSSHSSPVFENFEHVQSYFLLLSARFFKSDAFADFIGSVEKKGNKHEVIKCYELGLSALARQFNYTSGSFLNFSRDNVVYLKESAKLVAESGFPFLKRELFIRNPNDYFELVTTLQDIARSKKNKKLISLLLDHVARFSPEAAVYFVFKKNYKAQSIIHPKFIQYGYSLIGGYIKIKVRVFGLSVLKIPVRNINRIKPFDQIKQMIMSGTEL